jgi:hypothetical protein
MPRGLRKVETWRLNNASNRVERKFREGADATKGSGAR